MLRILRLNASEWFFIVIGCIAACCSGAVQPLFAIVFSEILSVSKPIGGVGVVMCQKKSLHIYSYEPVPPLLSPPVMTPNFHPLCDRSKCFLIFNFFVILSF